MNYIVISILVFLLAIFFRFYKINKIGLLWWDEASYFREARFMFTFFKFALNKKYRKLFFKPAIGDHISLNKTPEEINYLLEEAKKNVMFDPLIYVKPGNDFFITLCFQLFGIKDISVIIPNAVFGVLNVIVVFSLSYYIGDIKTAIGAALVLAISGAHVYHSRSGQVELKVAFFFSLAVFYYLILTQNLLSSPVMQADDLYFNDNVRSCN